MIIFCTCDLGGRVVRVWDEDAWIRCPDEFVVKLMGGDTSVIVVKKLEGGQD